jgi:hypothetical protein
MKPLMDLADKINFILYVGYNTQLTFETEETGVIASADISIRGKHHSLRTIEFGRGICVQSSINELFKAVVKFTEQVENDEI